MEKDYKRTKCTFLDPIIKHFPLYTSILRVGFVKEIFVLALQIQKNYIFFFWGGGDVKETPMHPFHSKKFQSQMCFSSETWQKNKKTNNGFFGFTYGKVCILRFRNVKRFYFVTFIGMVHILKIFDYVRGGRCECFCKYRSHNSAYFSETGWGALCDCSP